ncbi:hypothetical protein [Listeria monocytogenes]|uniref:hypothetical protein n=1 Tax=Listeria monocytogenes TaxID=1639 RepID=UPI0014032FF3|nr:hypothetical protein [Listeria monocytogenes]
MTAVVIVTWLQITIQDVYKDYAPYADSDMDIIGMGTTNVDAIMALSQVVFA